MTPVANPKLKVLVKQANGQTQALALADLGQFKLLPGTQLTLVDEATNQAPKGLRVKRVDKDLVLEIEGSGDVATVANFYDNADAAGASFYPQGELPAAGGSELVAVTAETAPVGATSAGQPIVWAAADTSAFGWMGALGGLGGLALAGGGGGATPVVEALSVLIKGSFLAGPVIVGHGLTATAYDNQGKTLATSALDNSGNFSFTIKGYSGPVLVRVIDTTLGADYFDEATGKPKDLSVAELRAVLSVVDGQSYTVNVNPLTEVAARKLGLAPDATSMAGFTPAQVAAANKSVTDALGLTTDLVTGAAPVAVITTTGGVNASSNVYGRMLAAVSGVDEGNSGNMEATFASLLEALAQPVAAVLAVSNILLSGAKNVEDVVPGFLAQFTDRLAEDFSLANAINELRLELQGFDNIGDYTTLKAVSDAVKALQIAIGEDSPLVATLANLQAQITSIINTNIADLQTQITAININIADLQDQITANDGDIAALAVRATTLEAAVTLLNNSASVTGSVKEQVATAKTAVELIISDLATRLDADIADLQTQVVALNAAIAAGDTLNADAITALSGELAEMQLALDALDSAYKGADTQLQASLNELQTQINDVQAVLDGLDSTAPTITGVALSATGADNQGALNAGDTVTAVVRFDEAVLVTGGPKLQLLIGEETVDATYVSGAGTDQLTFSYTVTGEDDGGVSIGNINGSLALNGSIRDAAGNAADLGYGGEDSFSFNVNNDPLELTLTAGALFGAQVQLPSGTSLLVGMLFTLGAEPEPVFATDLGSQGHFTVPDGARFLDADAFVLAMLDQRGPGGPGEPPVFVEGPAEVSISFAGKLAVPYEGPEFWIMVSAEILQGLQADALGDNGYLEHLLSMAISLDGSLDGSLAGETIADSVLEQISNYNPATVTLNVTTPLTVAQALALEQAGFDLADKVSFSVRDFATTVQAANASPAEKLIMLEASQVTLVGNELGNSVDLMAFDRLVKLRLEAGAGDDQILAGRANDVIVGQAGADHITLTTQDRSSDTIVYQTRFDGGSLPVTTLRFAQDQIIGGATGATGPQGETGATGQDGATGSTENITNYYREGSQLQVNINGVRSDYTMTGEDSAQDALQKLANEIMRENRAIDPSEVVAGFLISKSLLSVFNNQTFGLADSLLNALSNPVMLSQFDAKGGFKVPAGFVLLPPAFGEPVAQAGQTYRLGNYQHIVETQYLLVNSAPSILVNAGFQYALGDATNTGISVRWDAAKLLAAEVQPNNTINLVGAQVDTVIALGGEDNVEINNPGQATVRTVTFSGEDGQYVQDSADHKLRVTISFDDDNDAATADKEVTVEALIVGEDASDSVAALVRAINSNNEVNSWVNASSGEDNTVLTLTADNKGLETFNVSGAEIDTHGAQQKTSVTFSANNEDYYDKGTLSVTVAGKTFTADMVAGNASASVAALLAKVVAALDPSGTDRDPGVAAKLATAVQAETTVQRSPSLGTTLTFTAKEEVADPLNASAQLGYFGVAQQAKANFSVTDADYFEGGKLSLTIDTPNGAAVVVKADMVADNFAASMANLRAAVQTEYEKADSPLKGVIGQVGGTAGSVTLIASQAGDKSFEITEASISVAAVKQVTAINFSGTDDDDFTALATDDKNADTSEAGTLSVVIAGNTITADMADTKADTLANLQAAIEAEMTGLLSDVLGSVSLSKDVLTLTAKVAGADPLTVSGLAYSTPDLTKTDGVPASRPHTVLMNFNNTTLDGLVAGDTVAVLIDGVTTTLTIGSDQGQVDLRAALPADRSTAVLQALVSAIETAHGNTTALGSVVLGYVTQGVFTASVAPPGSFDTSLLLTAKLTGDSAYAVDALGKVGTNAIGITITKGAVNPVTVGNPGSTELVQLGNLVWAGTGTASGVTIDSTVSVGKDQSTLADDKSASDVLAVDNSVIAGQSGGVYTEDANGGAVLNNNDGTQRGIDTDNRVDVDAKLAVGEKPGTDPQEDSVSTVHDGFDPFFNIVNTDGRYLTLALGAEADVVHNFQVDHDFVALEGALLNSTLSGEDVEMVFGDCRENFDLSAFEFGLVGSGVSQLSAVELTDVLKVLSSLDDAFDFGGETSNNGTLNTTVFAITAEDDRSQTALWVHKQSSFGDDTVSADEMSLLAIVHTIGGEFGIQNFLPEPNYQTMPN